MSGGMSGESFIRSKDRIKFNDLIAASSLLASNRLLSLNRNAMNDSICLIYVFMNKESPVILWATAKSSIWVNLASEWGHSESPFGTLVQFIFFDNFSSNIINFLLKCSKCHCPDSNKFKLPLITFASLLLEFTVISSTVPIIVLVAPFSYRVNLYLTSI